jgi:hypothetical protein
VGLGVGLKLSSPFTLVGLGVRVKVIISLHTDLIGDK